MTDLAIATPCLVTATHYQVIATGVAEPAGGYLERCEIVDARSSLHLDGRAGTGKTYVVRAVIARCQALGLGVLIFAPTNVAALNVLPLAFMTVSTICCRSAPLSSLRLGRPGTPRGSTRLTPRRPTKRAAGRATKT